MSSDTYRLGATNGVDHDDVLGRSTQPRLVTGRPFGSDVCRASWSRCADGCWETGTGSPGPPAAADGLLGLLGDLASRYSSVDASV